MPNAAARGNCSDWNEKDLSDVKEMSAARADRKSMLTIRLRGFDPKLADDLQCGDCP
jgi:hypothetical protein